MNTITRTLIITLLILLPAMAFAAAPPVRVTLETLSATTLPKIPVTLRVTVENTSGAAIAFPRDAFLVVRNESGETFTVRTAPASHALHESNDALSFDEWPETLKAKGKATVLVESTGVFDDPAWFRDDRLHTPGRYELQLLVGNSVVGEQPLENLRGEVAASNFAPLRISVPAGEDAAVWSAMQEFREKHAHRDPKAIGEERMLWKDLAANFSRSAYAGWLLASGVGADASESNGLLKKWLNEHSDDPHRDWRLLIVARHEADKFAVAKEADAPRHDKAARDFLKQLKKSAMSDKMKKKADEVLADLEE